MTKKRSRRLVGYAAVVALLTTVLCAPPAVALDASGKIACRDFAKTLQKINDGILTDAEIRQEIKAAHENARLSDSAELRVRSIEMLRVATRGDAREILPAIKRFMDACVAPR